MTKNKVEINGQEYEIAEEDLEKSLLEYLREDLNLKGTKCGCGIGVCGTCMVIVEQKKRKACVTPLKKVIGKSVKTIEGISGENGALHPIQQAFIDAGAIQCGFCTPGMIITAYLLLQKGLHHSREEIRKALSGNLCRCTGYQQIVDAIELAQERIRDKNNDKSTKEV